MHDYLTTSFTCDRNTLILAVVTFPHLLCRVHPRFPTLESVGIGRPGLATLGSKLERTYAAEKQELYDLSAKHVGHQNLVADMHVSY